MLGISFAAAAEVNAEGLLDHWFDDMLKNFGDTLATIDGASPDIFGEQEKATRIFAAPNQYPPKDYAAYGILAFRANASEADVAWHLDICKAYVSALPLSTPKSDKSKQMVTVWPVKTTVTANALNKPAATDVCKSAVENYDLDLAQKAIRSARLQGREIDGRGPFLLAWSPTDKIGSDQAVILIGDFSDATTYEENLAIMTRWAVDIESDPSIWDPQGFTAEKLRHKIKSIVDRYGSYIEKAFKVKAS